MTSIRKNVGRHRAPSKWSSTARIVSASAAAVAIGLLGAPSASAAPDEVWDRLAQCESSGNWAINTGNGYSGGLQFSPSTWRAFGGSGSAHNASRQEQIRVAERVLAGQGWGAWPACSKKLGLRGKGGPVAESARAGAAPKAPFKAVPAATGTYRVVAGDTLGKIAAAHRTTWQALFAKNRATLSNPDKIFPGQNLKI